MNRKISIFGAVVLTATSAMQFAVNIEASDIQYQSTTNIILGDINGDGEVTPEDDKLFKDYFAGKNVPISYQNADVNEDFIVNRKDAMILARHFAGWDGYTSLGNRSEKLPWENGGKSPEQYTWEEFEALDGSQQIAFQNYFDSFKKFEAWMEKAQNAGAVNPWENGGKSPEQYTWAEFEALDGAQQIAFQNYLGEKGFKEWMEKAQNTGSDNPWENGGKSPEQYTWAEFEALGGAQQIAFQNYLGEKGFKEWMEKAQNTGSDNPWENGGKSPEQYTWAEFEALGGAQQIAFQNYLGEKGFEEWFDKNYVG